MRNIKLTLQYDGAEFAGYELQAGQRTVRGELEEALKHLLKQKIKLNSTSRTDSGVHALCLTVNFSFNGKIRVESIKAALNSVLPETIRIIKAEEVANSFNSRFAAKKKTYEYLIFNGEVLPPSIRHFVWQVRPPLDLKKMRQEAKKLVGKHDFKRFCAAHSEAKNYVRTLFAVAISRRKIKLWDEIPVISIKVTGDGFLYKMVRNIVGHLVEVGLGKRSARYCAPARGLCLVKINY